MIPIKQEGEVQGEKVGDGDADDEFEELKVKQKKSLRQMFDEDQNLSQGTFKEVNYESEKEIPPTYMEWLRDQLEQNSKLLKENSRASIS